MVDGAAQLLNAQQREAALAVIGSDAFVSADVYAALGATGVDDPIRAMRIGADMIYRARFAGHVQADGSDRWVKRASSVPVTTDDDRTPDPTAR